MGQIKRKFIYSLLFGVTFLSTGYSQQPWSLERCIMYALENNIQIKQQELDKRVRENALLQSKLDILPSLNADYSLSSAFGRALDQTTYQFTENQTVVSSNLSATASFTIFNGFQKYNTIKESQMNLLASLKDLEKLKNDISLNIAASYLQILLNIELLTAAKNQYEITLQQVERTNKLVNAGSLPKANLLEIQAQAASKEVQVVTAQNYLELSYLTLTQLLEIDSINGFEIEIPKINIPKENEMTEDVNSIFEKSSSILPQIKSAEYRLSSARRGLKIAQGGFSPIISLSGTYYTGYSDARKKVIGGDSIMYPIGITQSGENVNQRIWINDFGNYPYLEQFSDNANTSLSLNIRIPIFNGWRVNRSVSNAKIAILNSEYNLELAKNVLYRDIQQAYADAKASLKKYIASEKALNSMEESFNYTQQRYVVGLVNITDYNAAQNQLATTRSDLLQSKYEYIFKVKILDFYQGKTITL